MLWVSKINVWCFLKHFKRNIGIIEIACRALNSTANKAIGLGWKAIPMVTDVQVVLSNLCVSTERGVLRTYLGG